jgi:SOS-response transcriptional repressor LexA
MLSSNTSAEEHKRTTCLASYPQATQSNLAFAVTVEDDSLVPEARPGDILIIDMEQVPANDDIVCVFAPKLGTAFRRYCAANDGGQVGLDAVNAEYPNVVMDQDELTVFGKVVEIHKKL